MTDDMVYVYAINPDGSDGEYLGAVGTYDPVIAVAVISERTGRPVPTLEGRCAPKIQGAVT